jgi:hypothetical protein
MPSQNDVTRMLRTYYNIVKFVMRDINFDLKFVALFGQKLNTFLATTFGKKHAEKLNTTHSH